MVCAMNKIKISEILLAPLSIVVLPVLAVWSLVVFAFVVITKPRKTLRR
jgi:hypothetical protein